MIEEITSGTLMETQLMHRSSMMQLLPFIHPVWMMTKLIAAEELREEIEDMDQGVEQTEGLARDMDQTEGSIEEQKEDSIEDPIEEQEVDQAEEVNPAAEQEEGDNMVPRTNLEIDTAMCARNKDTIHYFVAPSCQSIFPEAVMSNLFPESCVNTVSQLVGTSGNVLIDTLQTTKTGCVS